MLALTILLRTLIFGSDWLFLLNSSLSSTNLAASVGILMQVSLKQPAGFFSKLAAFMTFRLKVRSQWCYVRLECFFMGFRVSNRVFRMGTYMQCSTDITSQEILRGLRIWI